MIPRRSRGAPWPAVAALFLLVAAWPAAAATPSPADWRDLMIYQVLTDRFTDGDPTNDNAEGSYDAATGNRTHGGDFSGLTRRLDYLKGLGVGAVWISPVHLNAFGEYHGYAARDFYSISSQFGGLAGLQGFVEAAHARGIYVIIDVVLNHTGDMIDSGTSGYPGYRADPSPYQLRWRSPAPRAAAPFDDLTWYHNNGNIGSFSDPEQILGELFGLDDLKTERTEVRDALVAATNWLILNSDCDGFRIDTVKHVEIGFWQYWAPRVQAYCRSIGKSDFLMFGEVFDGSDAKCGWYTGAMAGGPEALNSLLYYPMHFTTNDVFVYDQPTAGLTGRYAGLTNYDPAARDRLVTFLDNHDNPRFLAAEKASQDTTRLRVALDWLLTSLEIPCLYYGTEQAFDGGGDPWCREDMWDGLWDYGPSEGDNFRMTHPLYLQVMRLNNWRRLFPALTRGTQTMLQQETAGPGLYVYSRQHAGQEVIVALNSAATARTTTALPTTFGALTSLVDLADTAAVIATGGSGTVTLTVPGRSARIVTRRVGPVRLDPYVLSQSPAHDSRAVPSLNPVQLLFSEPMDTLSVMGAFDIAPGILGSFGWSADRWRLTFQPLEPMTVGGTYQVRVDTGARDVTGRPLRAAFETFFRIGAGAVTGIVVPAGFKVEVVAQDGLSIPEGLAFGPAESGWSGDLYVGDQGLRRLLRLTTSGQLSTFASSSTLYRKPEGLAFDRAAQYGGRLLSADDGQYVRTTSGGSASAFGGSQASATTGTIATAPAGPFLGLAYVSSTDLDRISRLGTNGSLTTFATGIRGAEGLTFGPGGAWGSDLFVADANLTSLAASIDGDGAIVRVNSSGVATTVALDPRLAGASALAFDTIGRFDGALYVSDIAGEKILRVTPDGQVEVFASGFGNLFASGGLAFGPDGALYVADSGGGQPFSDSSGGTAVGRVLRIVNLDTTGVPEAPSAVRLAGSPNPFRSSATIEFDLPVLTPVTLRVYDGLGRVVASLVDDRLEARTHRISWDGTGSDGRARPAGVYFARLEAGGVRRTIKLVKAE